MSIVEEALSRLQEKKNAERTDFDGNVSDAGKYDSELIPALEEVSREKPWKRTWLFLFLGLFVLVGLSGGLFWWMQNLQTDSVFIAQPQHGPLSLPNGEIAVKGDLLSGDQGVSEVVTESEASERDLKENVTTLDKPEAVLDVIEKPQPEVAGGASEVLLVVSEDAVKPSTSQQDHSDIVFEAASSADSMQDEKSIDVEDVPNVEGLEVKHSEPEIVLSEDGSHVDAPTSQESPKELPDPFLHVKRMISRGDFEEAISHLAPLVEFNPEDWETWFWLGTAHLGLNQLPDASRALDEALARNGESAQIWVQRAIVAQQQEKHHLALQLLYEAQRHGPNMPEVYLNKGFSFEILGRLEGATRNFRAFLELSEGNAVYMNQRRKVIQWLIQREANQ